MYLLVWEYNFRIVSKFHSLKMSDVFDDILNFNTFAVSLNLFMFLYFPKLYQKGFLTWPKRKKQIFLYIIFDMLFKFNCLSNSVFGIIHSSPMLQNNHINLILESHLMLLAFLLEFHLRSWNSGSLISVSFWAMWWSLSRILEAYFLSSSKNWCWHIAWICLPL